MHLTAITSSLTVNLVLNLRKLFSLIISVMWFGNPITRQGFYGILMVFAGTILYTIAGAGYLKPKSQKPDPIQEESRKER